MGNVNVYLLPCGIGHGSGVVIAIGKDTEFGIVFNMMKEVKIFSFWISLHFFVFEEGLTEYYFYLFNTLSFTFLSLLG